MIADASAVVPLLIDHPMTDAARRLLSGRQLVSPAIMLTEAANALWAYSLRGGISADQIDASLIQLRTVVLLLPDDSILTTAVRLAVENRHPVYDCLYLGLALEQRQPLATADRKLAALAGKLSIETELIEPAP